MRSMTCLLLFLLIFCAAGASATDVGSLYSARVSVADRSDTEFKRGVARALEAVIIKLTGSSDGARSAAAREVVGRAQRLVQQFGYELRGERGGERDTLMLRAEFDPRVLTAEMRARSLVVWGKERPDTLVWLILDDVTGRRLLNAQDEHPALDAFKARADARGIPLVLPLGDITEASAIGGAPSAAAMAGALRESSEKFGVRAILVGHIQQVTPDLWESSWHLTVGDESMDWDEQGDLAAQLGEEASDTLADALGRRYAAAVEPGSAETVALTVRNLSSAQDYARTERYLRSLDSVSRVLVRRVDENGIVFDLNLQGGIVALRQGISFGQTLSPDPADPTVYRLNPR